MPKLSFEEYKERVGVPNYSDEYKAAFKRIHNEDLDQMLEDNLRSEYELYCKDQDEGWVEVK